MMVNKWTKKILSFLAVALCMVCFAPTVSIIKAESVATLTPGEVKVFYSEEDSVCYSDEYESYTGGLVVAGNENVEIALGTIDLTENYGVNAPIFKVMPYFGDWGNNSGLAYLEKNAPFYDFYVDLVSVENPNKFISFKFGTRSGDNGELNIAVRGDGQNYGAETWASQSAKKFQYWGAGTATNTQKYNLASQTIREIFYDRQGKLVKGPHPIAIYYDSETHTTYTDTGVYDESKGYTHLREDAFGEYRYRMRDLDNGYSYKKDGQTTSVSKWTPFTSTEAEEVRVVVRFGRYINDDKVCKLVFYSFANEDVSYPILGDDSGKKIGEAIAENSTFTQFRYDVKYISEGARVGKDTFDVGENTTAPENPTREGYVFGGWFVGENAFQFGTPLTSDVTLTAKWKKACPNCLELNNEDATSCACGYSFVSEPSVEEPKKEKESGCGKEATTLLAVAIATLGALLIAKR